MTKTIFDLKQLALAIAMWFILFSSLQAKIIEVKNLELFETEIECLTEEDLVLLDIDLTLLIEKDISLKPGYENYLFSYFDSLPWTEQVKLYSIIIRDGEEEFVEEKFPILIRQLQQKNIPLIGFTSLRVGRFGQIEQLEEWRLSRLLALDIDFTKTFPIKNTIILTDVNLSQVDALFKDGVLFANRLPKGVVLKEFFEEIKWKPKKIIFVDDTLSKLESVERLANQLDISFTGFYYRAAYVKDHLLNKEIADIQFQTLIEKEIWLSDEAAKIQLISEQERIEKPILPGAG